MEEQIAELQQQLEDLKTLQATPASAPVVNIKVPIEKKLRKFGGSTTDLKDWIEDCQGIVQSLPKEDQISFIHRHLEGAAREEVQFQSQLIDDNTDKLFEVLTLVFGERCDSTQLKKLLYDRVQKERESLLEFSRALSDLVTRLCSIDKSVQPDTTLCEVFSQNVRNKDLRRYLKQMRREYSDISFFDLRQKALQWQDDEGLPSKTASVSNVSENNVSVLTQQIAQLCTVQEQILKHLQLQGNVASSNSDSSVRSSASVPPGTPATKSDHKSTSPDDDDFASSVQCHYCKKYGHYKSGCPRRFRKKHAQSQSQENSNPLPSRATQSGAQTQKLAQEN